MSVVTMRHPFWAPDGRHLYYFGVNRFILVAAPITLQPRFSLGVPTALAGDLVSNVTARGPLSDDVTPGGTRIVRTVGVATTANLQASAIRVVLNWFELKQRVPIV